MHSDKCLLHQVLCCFPIADASEEKIKECHLITVIKDFKGPPHPRRLSFDILVLHHVIHPLLLHPLLKSTLDWSAPYCRLRMQIPQKGYIKRENIC